MEMFDIDYFEYVLKRFWRNVNKTNGCWLWKNPSGNGYGYLSINDTGVLAHRMSWIIHYGSLKNMWVLHKCDNPACVRPDHLFLGTQTDNMRDCGAKGRHPGSNGKNRGDKHPLHKLNEEKVREIRFGDDRVTDLAQRFGVSKSLVSSIRKGKAWPHVTA